MFGSLISFSSGFSSPNLAKPALSLCNWYATLTVQVACCFLSPFWKNLCKCGLHFCPAISHEQQVLSVGRPQFWACGERWRQLHLRHSSLGVHTHARYRRCYAFYRCKHCFRFYWSEFQSWLRNLSASYHAGQFSPLNWLLDGQFHHSVRPPLFFLISQVCVFGLPFGRNLALIRTQFSCDGFQPKCGML